MRVRDERDVRVLLAVSAGENTIDDQVSRSTAEQSRLGIAETLTPRYLRHNGPVSIGVSQVRRCTAPPYTPIHRWRSASPFRPIRLVSSRRRLRSRRHGTCRRRLAPRSYDELLEIGRRKTRTRAGLRRIGAFDHCRERMPPTVRPSQSFSLNVRAIEPCKSAHTNVQKKSSDLYRTSTPNLKPAPLTVSSSGRSKPLSIFCRSRLRWTSMTLVCGSKRYLQTFSSSIARVTT